MRTLAFHERRINSLQRDYHSQMQFSDTLLANRSGVYFNSRYRNNKLAAPVPYVAQLIHDFVLEVPWENQHVIGPRFLNSVG
jgi:hypothetical protein